MKSYCDRYWKVLQGFDDKDILNRLTGNQNDETLQNFIKRKHPKKEREKRQEARTKRPDPKRVIWKNIMKSYCDK
jgi:hypothetical protein